MLLKRVGKRHSSVETKERVNSKEKGRIIQINLNRTPLNLRPRKVPSANPRILVLSVMTITIPKTVLDGSKLVVC